MFPLMKSNCFQLMLTKLQLFCAEPLPVSRNIFAHYYLLEILLLRVNELCLAITSLMCVA